MRFLPVLLAISLILAACSAVPQAISNPTQPVSPRQAQPTLAPSPTPVEANPAAAPASESPDQTRVDEQGNVVVEVTPANLDHPGETLEFEVALNTHSVDLSLDLATVATLTTDTGKTVPASLWDAPLGGHHVSGKLVFPATVDGQLVLEGAKKVTLTILNLDAPERVFEWELGS